MGSDTTGCFDDGGYRVIVKVISQKGTCQFGHQVDDMIATFNRIFELSDQIEVPIIAAIQGYCLGGGMELAIACDVIVAAEGAQFGQPEIKVGFFPPYAAIRLPQLVGPAKAIEICTTGKFYSAREAQGLGMVAHVAEEGQLDETAAKLVKEIQAAQQSGDEDKLDDLLEDLLDLLFDLEE